MVSQHLSLGHIFTSYRQFEQRVLMHCIQHEDSLVSDVLSQTFLAHYLPSLKGGSRDVEFGGNGLPLEDFQECDTWHTQILVKNPSSKGHSGPQVEQVSPTYLKPEQHTARAVGTPDHFDSHQGPMQHVCAEGHAHETNLVGAAGVILPSYGRTGKVVSAAFHLHFPINVASGSNVPCRCGGVPIAVTDGYQEVWQLAL